MTNIDLNSFEVCVGSKYAKDKKNIYYPLEITCVDEIDCGVCSCTKYIIKAGNVMNFKYLGRDYSINGTMAYFRGQAIEQADGNTFKVINGPEFFFSNRTETEFSNMDNCFLMQTLRHLIMTA